MMSFSCNWRISEHSLSPRLRAERVRLQQRRPTSPCKSEKCLQKCSARPCPCWCLIVAMPPQRCRQSAGRPCSPPEDPGEGASTMAICSAWWAYSESGVLPLVGPRPRPRPTIFTRCIMAMDGPRVTWQGRSRPTHTLAHSCPPRRRPFDRSTCSGCTTRRCRVNASFLLNVFSSVHSGQCTFCFLALWMVSSCRVRS